MHYNTLNNLLYAFSSRSPYIAYEHDTFDEPSDVFPCKMDENCFLTLSYSPQAKRLRLFSLFLKSLGGQDISFPELLSNSEGDLDDLWDLTKDCLRSMIRVLQSNGFHVVLEDYDHTDEENLSFIEQLILDNMTDEDDFFQVIEDEFDFICDREVVAPKLFKPMGYQNMLSFFFPLNYSNYTDDDVWALFACDIVADYFESESMFLKGEKSNSQQKGYLLIFTWGCPVGYFGNIAPFSSFDIASLGVNLLAICNSWKMEGAELLEANI